MIRNNQSCRPSNNFIFHVPLDLLTQLTPMCSPASLQCCLGSCHINNAPLHMDHSHLMLLVIPTITSTTTIYSSHKYTKATASNWTHIGRCYLVLASRPVVKLLIRQPHFVDWQNLHVHVLINWDIKLI